MLKNKRTLMLASGAPANSSSDPRTSAPALRRAIASDRPALVNVCIDPEAQAADALLGQLGSRQAPGDSTGGQATSVARDSSSGAHSGCYVQTIRQAGETDEGHQHRKGRLYRLSGGRSRSRARLLPGAWVQGSNAKRKGREFYPTGHGNRPAASQNRRRTVPMLSGARTTAVPNDISPRVAACRE